MLTTGPNLGLLDNGGYGEQSYDELMRLFRGIDLLVQPRVKSLSVVTPPATPSEGDAYLLPAGVIDAWQGHDGDIARWSARSSLTTPTWEFFTPKQGWTCAVDDLDQCVRFNGSTWVGSGIVISTSPPNDSDGQPNGTIHLQVL